MLDTIRKVQNGGSMNTAYMLESGKRRQTSGNTS